MKHLKKLKLTLPLALLALAFLRPDAARAQYASTNFQVISGPSQTVLTWDGIYYADHYSLARSTTSGGPYTTIAADIPNNNKPASYGDSYTESYTDTDVTNGVEYFYLLTAVWPELFPTEYSSPEAAGIPLALGGTYSFVNRLSGLALGQHQWRSRPASLHGRRQPVMETGCHLRRVFCHL